MSLRVIGTPDFKNGPLSPLFSIPALQYKGSSQRYGPINGLRWVLRFESPASEDISIASPAEEGLNLVVSGGIYEAEVLTGGPTHELTIICPDVPGGGTGSEPGVISTHYELLGNDLQMDLREHPKALALGYAVIRTIDAVLSQSVDPNIDAVPTESDIPAGDATELYRLLRQRNGNGYFLRSQYVFRYTRIASDRSTIDVGYSSVGQILTTADMIAETGPPPGILASISDAATGANPGVSSGYSFGWLKRTPTVSTAAGNKFQVSGEYWLADWSTWIYD